MIFLVAQKKGWCLARRKSSYLYSKDWPYHPAGGAQADKIVK
jgi:hypothetical protein